MDIYGVFNNNHLFLEANLRLLPNTVQGLEMELKDNYFSER